MIFNKEKNLEIQFKLQNTLIKIFNSNCIKPNQKRIQMILGNIQLYLKEEKTFKDI